MCCFSTKTEVFQTNIFARLTRPTAQIVVYQMRYAASGPTAMILPLPVALPAGEGSVRWRSLKQSPEFFERLAGGFPVVVDTSRAKSAPAEATAAAALPVHEVGDFIASFVPTVGDFDRLDPRFSIRRDVWSQIPGYHDYGFAVFQLKQLAGVPHPIAFDFETRLRDTVFFPTVHIHDGTVHARDEFHHALYLQDGRFDGRVSDYEGPDHVDRATGLVRSQSKAVAFADVAGSEGAVDGDLLVHRMTLTGVHPNTDTLVNLVPAASTLGCARCEIDTGTPPSLGAAPAALACLAWIVRRREQLRRR